jgi:uncharacterized membrane protein (DUF4010 family)
VDALIVSMTRNAGTELPAAVAARAITVGILSNTLLKLLIGVCVGSKAFRRIVALGLSVVALACGARLAWLP